MQVRVKIDANGASRFTGAIAANLSPLLARTLSTFCGFPGRLTSTLSRLAKSTKTVLKPLLRSSLTSMRGKSGSLALRACC